MSEDEETQQAFVFAEIGIAALQAQVGKSGAATVRFRPALRSSTLYAILFFDRYAQILNY